MREKSKRDKETQPRDDDRQQESQMTGHRKRYET